MNRRSAQTKKGKKEQNTQKKTGGRNVQTNIKAESDEIEKEKASFFES